MKIKVPQHILLSGIQVVQNIVSQKATLPILSNMLIETKQNSLRLNTTDLDIGISCVISVEILEEGAVTIPAKKFHDIVRELPEGDVIIHARKNNQIDIEGTQCRFKLIGLPKDEFPKFPEFKENEPIEINQNDLKEMIRLTAFAVSHEESRYVLNGVLMEIEGKTIRFVATDGRRLAKMEGQLTQPVQEEIKAIIPIKAIGEINRNLKEEGVVTILTTQNQILFNIDGTLIATRVIEGDFPHYNQVIPKVTEQKVNVQAQLLLSAIRRANLLSTPDFQAIKFEIFKNKLVISKSTPDLGESREEISMDYQGTEMVVGFNPQFLIDVLKQINQENIYLELTGPDKPCVIREDNYLYLVLPMRL